MRVVAVSSGFKRLVRLVLWLEIGEEEDLKTCDTQRLIQIKPICSIFLSDENSNMYEEVDKLSSETRSGSSLSLESPVYENAAMVAGKWRVGRHGQLRFGCNRFKLNFFEKACFFTRLLVIADEKQVLPKFLSLSNSSQIATVLECGVQRLRHLCPPWLGLPAFQLVARLARIPARGSITFSTESFDNG
ncbi:unnamed protein product [Brassica oleracea]|uniref:(rape) hypothetical protein n=1 Tax=Brassica napus TaxID=3708 RepID=A0A816RK94_BRANA|nr:unnamed protein product [Brassica napus]